MRRAEIYRPAGGSDCTNGGVTSRLDHIRIFEVDEEIPENVTVNDFYEENRGNRAEPYWAAIPLVRPDALCGPMYGGNIAVARYDGKPERIYHVHDRFETPELNAVMST